MSTFEQEVAAAQAWFDSPRFAGIVRLYTARQVVEQRAILGLTSLAHALGALEGLQHPLVVAQVSQRLCFLGPRVRIR